MATTDKHPPLDPNRHSTNKRVKPLGENIFGTPVLTAEGSKRVKPGDPNTTSARTMGPGETPRQRWDREKEERARALEATKQQKESYLSEARAKLLKRGWLTQNDAMILQRVMRSNRT